MLHSASQGCCSLGVGTFELDRSLGEGIKVRKAYCLKYVDPNRNYRKGCAKLYRDGRGIEQARRACNPNQSPDTLKTYFRARFVVSIDLEQLYFEDESGVCWDDRWETAGSVCLQMLQISNCILCVKLRT